MKTSVVIAPQIFCSPVTAIVGDYNSCFARAQEAGFDAVQLTVLKPEKEPVEDIKRFMQETGLAVSGIATGLASIKEGLYLGASDGAIRNAAVQRMKEHIALAEKLGGARVIIGAVRGWARDVGDKDAFLKNLDRSLQELLSLAQEKGIVLILESMNHLEADSLCSIRETSAFIRKFGSPFLRLQIDSLHMWNEQEEIRENIISAGDLISQVDISDAGRNMPDGNHFDFACMIKALKDIEYSDYLVFEFRSEPPAKAAERGLSYIRNLINS